MRNAILIVEPDTREQSGDEASGKSSLTVLAKRVTPLVCAEVLGRSVVERLIDDLLRAGVETVRVCGDLCEIERGHPRLQACTTEEAWTAVREESLTCMEASANAVLVVRVSAYVDFDLKNLLQFHREHGKHVTRAFDENGPLDMWIVTPAVLAEGSDLMTILAATEPVPYLVPGYVNRLECADDLRRLAVDGLTARCGLRPQGAESRSGVWMGDDSQVHRNARIVGPAFIGRGVKIAEQCLITRCSNIESNCQVDYGTVVEDSSILPNSYVGIGLDLSHSIVDGNNLLNLERGVMLQIADPCVIQRNKISSSDRKFRSPGSIGLGRMQLVQAEEGSH